MKAKSFLVGGLLTGAMLMATSVGASANFAWCMADPPVQVVTPGDHSVTVNNKVYLPADEQDLLGEVSDVASARPDGRGGTLITVSVFVPAPAHVVSSVNRYDVSAAKDGDGVVTLVLDVPIS